MPTTRRVRPPRAVLDAFRLGGRAEPLPGGQQTAWRVGNAVLKPLDIDPALLSWQAGLLARLDGRSDFRVSVPLQTVDGSWTAHGWTAWRYQPGSHVAGRWHDVLEVGRRLHVALEAEPEPPSLRARTDVWAVADRVAWAELPASDHAGTPHLRVLSAALRPVSVRRQLVHGDLTGNVLFSPGLPPLVIDLSLYWRPPAFAAAVVVADAVVFEGAGPEVLDSCGVDTTFPQLLLRALVFRLVSAHLLRPDEQDRTGERYAAAVEKAVRLACLA